jgi:hypothetical protein
MNRDVAAEAQKVSRLIRAVIGWMIYRFPVTAVSREPVCKLWLHKRRAGRGDGLTRHGRREGSS